MLLHIQHTLPLITLSVFLCMLLGGCGFFSSSDITSPPPAAYKIVKTAYSQIGKDYKLGGASPKSGFDCSGLLFWVYNKHGYKLPRTTSAQAKAGRGISKTSACEGDILVFKVAQSPRGLHTGIYTGKNCFIHSPSKGKKVKIDSVNNTYWKERLIAVRRVVR